MILFTSSFYLKTYEEYVTGVMELGFINPVDEGIVFLVIVLLISGIFGNSLWSKSIGFWDLDLSDLMLIIFTFTSSLFVIQSLIKIIKAQGIV